MQDGMDVTANNIANVNTYGFKPSRPAFSDLIYTLRNPDNEDTEMGHGVKLNGTDLLYEEGSVRQTERPLDFCILGESLFAIQNTEGNVYYTKDGGFQMQQQEDGQWYLIDDYNGNVLDQEGQPIVIPFDGETGDITEIDTRALVETIGRFRFENPCGLLQRGNNYFEVSATSGEAIGAPEAEMMSGWLEASSASLAKEMTNVITFQRAFSANIKMVQTADEVEQIVNNLR